MVSAHTSGGTFKMAAGSIINDDPAGAAIEGSGLAVITMSGGTVTASGSIAIETNGANVTVSNGTVSNTGTGDAIRASSATVTLSGGTVSATTGTTIEAYHLYVGGASTIIENDGGTSPAVKVSVNLQTNGVGADAKINGNVVAGAVYSYSGGSQLTINGSVTLNGTAIYVNNGGKLYITGTVGPGARNINISGTDIPVGTPTTANGLTQGGYYWDVYTDGTSYVYLRQAAITL